MRVILFFAFIAIHVGLFAQSNYASLNETYYHWIDRYEVKTGGTLPQLFTSIKPYKRSAIISFLDSASRLEVFRSEADRFNLAYMHNDSWEWARPETNDSRKPLLRHLYKKKSDLLYVDIPEFDLHVNPVLYLGAGRDSRSDNMLFTNTRGMEVRGMVDKRVGFYTFLTENQVRLADYISRTIANDTTLGYYPVIPHEGFWKTFKGNKGYDFFQARGYITFEATRHINLQFGHDRFFIGNGYRSLIFSDVAPPAWFLKGNLKVWKLNYFYLLNQFTANVRGTSGGTQGLKGGYPQKFVALHHLSINIGKKLNLGVFESVVFSPDDETGASRFRLDYLNPVIFFRAIEQQNGSSDNVILGADFKWNALKNIQFYGQFVLDEFLLDNLRDGNGWWANKFGVQLGAKYIDAFNVPNLDLQAETNLVRPYTYSHNTKYGSYSHYRQALAHPLGANFKEVVGIARFQPVPKLAVTGKLIYAQIGRDTLSFNFGSDILKNNSYRKTYQTDANFGNTIGQGVGNTIILATLTASWQLKHNLFIDATATIRNSESAATPFNNSSTITSLALRWNIAQRLYEF
ncbi:MAG: hypothetical protein KF725_09880 [Cyclobacteriaceae bacterium]|nr:hypothetical protein [Cyclobacteriaceae bacterium]UYN86022.1 MAG: hypothetical protein KIT51_14275 [Cyclobacteriaceae bacterium]